MKEKLIAMDEEKELIECKQIKLIYPIVHLPYECGIGKDKGVGEFCDNRVIGNSG